MRYVLLLSVLAATASCKARCDPSYCDGNVLHSCVDEHDSDDYWVVKDCEDRFCVAYDGDAYCAQEPTPRPACNGVPWLQYACDEGELIQCLRGGHALTRATCGAPDLCEASIASCLVHPGTDAECARRHPSEQHPAAYCADAMLIECEGEHAVEATACPVACHAGSVGAACVVSASPDSVACPRYDSGWPYEACANNTVMTCIDSYEIDRYPCTQGTCVVHPDYAGCRL